MSRELDRPGFRPLGYRYPLLWTTAIGQRWPADIYREAAAKDHPDHFPLAAGQSVGLVNNLPTAAEVIGTILQEARAVLREGLPQNITLNE